MSENENQVIEPAIDETATATAPIAKDEPEFVTGTVVGCRKLNVRMHPSIEAEVMCVLRAGTEVQVDASNHYDDWYYVCTESGADGFCMKQYISVNQ